MSDSSSTNPVTPTANTDVTTETAGVNTTTPIPTNASTIVVGNSLESFQKKYPQFYAQFMEAWGIQAVLQAKDQNDQLIQIIQDARADDQD